MEDGKNRENTRTVEAVEYLNCLDALAELADGLAGLGGLVFGQVEVARSCEVTEESLQVIMLQLYGYSDKARETMKALEGAVRLSS